MGKLILVQKLCLTSESPLPSVASLPASTTPPPPPSVPSTSTKTISVESGSPPPPLSGSTRSAPSPRESLVAFPRPPMLNSTRPSTTPPMLSRPGRWSLSPTELELCLSSRTSSRFTIGPGHLNFNVGPTNNKALLANIERLIADGEKNASPLLDGRNPVVEGYPHG